MGNYVTTLDMSASVKPIAVPREVATCPICDADIVIDSVNPVSTAEEE